MENSELQKLAEQIENLDQPSLDPALKAQMRQRLMRRVLFEKSLFEEMREVRIPEVQKARIKENVFARIGDRVRIGFSWSNFLYLNRKVFSGVMVLVLFAGTFVMVNVNDSVVVASQISYVNSFGGQVEIYRGGDRLNVSHGFEIKEGDEIVTGQDGVLEIYFFENSASRLAPNSHLKVNDLEDETRRVELELAGGRVWSKVVNNEKDAKFFVKADDKEVAAVNHAAFDVAYEEDSFSVGVFSEEVDVMSKDNAEKVSSGKKVLIAADQLEVLEIDDEEKKVSWVAENLEIDEKYLTEVEKRFLVKKVDSLGKDAVQKSLEKNKLFLNFTDVDKKKANLDELAKALTQAQIDFEAGDLSEEKFKLSVQALELAVKEFSILLEDIAKTDQKYATELQYYYDAKLALLDKLNAVEAEETVEIAAKEEVEVEAAVSVPVKEEISTENNGGIDGEEEVKVEEELQEEEEEKVLPPLL